MGNRPLRNAIADLAEQALEVVVPATRRWIDRVREGAPDDPPPPDEDPPDDDPPPPPEPSEDDA